jgi:2-aminoadipate transaminase
MSEVDTRSTAAGPQDWAHRLARRTRRSGDADIGGILALANAQGLINFSGGFPEPSLFPVGVAQSIITRLVAEDAAVAMQYSASEGLSGTRDALSDRLFATQGVRPRDDELMVTSGGIDALTLISRSMLDPGDEVLVEGPTYLGAIAGFVGSDAVVRTVRVDSDGLDVEALADILSGSAAPPKLLYTIPDHQNPSGRVLEPSRRAALVELCRRHGVLIVEDVAYRELGFDGTAAPSLWSLGPDITVQIGTFSKVLFPGVRLGWAVGPSAVLTELVVAKQNSDQCAGALGQRLLEDYLRGGHLDAALPAARSLYRSRGQEMDAALSRHFTGLGDWTSPRGGFFCWLHIPGVDTSRLATAALAAGVAFVPGAGFFADHSSVEHLRLSFSRVEQSEIDEGIARLADIARAARG